MNEIVKIENIEMLKFMVDRKKYLEFNFKTDEIYNLVVECIEKEKYKMSKIIIKNFNVDSEKTLDIILTRMKIKILHDEKIRKIVNSLLGL